MKASVHDTGYILADAVSKVADKADKAVGSVNAPGWVLPVSYVPFPHQQTLRFELTWLP